MFKVTATDEYGNAIAHTFAVDAAEVQERIAEFLEACDALGPGVSDLVRFDVVDADAGNPGGIYN